MLTLFSGTMTDVPLMVISLDAFRPPLIQGVVPPPGITPGARVASENGFRLDKGRSRIALLPITVDTLDDSVVSCAALATISTVVARSPTFKGISRVTVWATATRTSLSTYF